MRRTVVSGSAINSPNSAEGVILTLPLTPLPEEPGGFLWSHITVDAFLNFTPGTSATVLTVRIRRGTTIGGTLIGTALALPCVAGSPMSLTIMADDTPVGSTPALVPGQIYVVTAQQTGGAAAGVANYAVAHTTAT